MKLILDDKQPNITEVKIACGTLHFVIGYDTEGKIRFFLYVSHRSGGCAANLVGIASLLTLWYNDGRLNRQKVIEELFEIDCQKGCLLINFIQSLASVTHAFLNPYISNFSKLSLNYRYLNSICKKFAL